MSISLSSALSTATVAAANSSSNVGPAVQNAAARPQPTSNQAGYRVELSEAQQVYQLYNQGQQIRQIAETLNLSVGVVNSYLGVTHWIVF
jgi:DNA-binding NarL/FixJ family response regulator